MLRGGSGRGRVPTNDAPESRRGKSWKGKQPRPNGPARAGNGIFRGQSTAQGRGRLNPRAPTQPQEPARAPFSAGNKNASFQDRWQALKKEHDQERSSAIAKGLISDPDKPRTLAEAITPVGTCQDKCPEYERVERVVQKDVWKEEWDPTRLPEKVVAEHRMVKKFRRAAAGLDEQLPSDLRPPPVLQKAVEYLFKDLLNEAFALENVHHFIWDRTRAIRNDFSIQQLTEVADVRIAVYCYELIARFHILSLHQLGQPDRQYDMYDVYQEREQLDRTLLSLMQYYDDIRQEYRSPNEAEFRAYCIILQIQDPLPDLEDRVQTWSSAVVQDMRVQTALKLHAAAANVTDPQGPLKPRQPHPIAQANWARFWSLVGSHEVSYLMACVAEIYFTLVRQTALNAIWQSYRQSVNVKSEDWSLAELVEVFGFDDEEQVEAFCKLHHFNVVEREDGLSCLDLSSVRGRRLPDPPRGTKYPYFSQELVEPKRQGRLLTVIIFGTSVDAARKAGLVEETEDDATADEDDANISLFLPEPHAVGTDAESMTAGVISNVPEAETKPDKNEQDSTEVLQASQARNNAEAFVQNHSAPLHSFEQANNLTHHAQSSNTPGNPFSFGKTSSSISGTTSSTPNPFALGKPTQPLAGGTTLSNIASTFGKPSSTWNSSTAFTSQLSASSPSFAQGNANKELAGNSQGDQKPLASNVFSAFNRAPAATVDKTGTSPVFGASTLGQNPFGFPSTNTTNSPSPLSFATTQNLTAKSSSVSVNPFAPRPTTTAGKPDLDSTPLFPSPSTPKFSFATEAASTSSASSRFTTEAPAAAQEQKWQSMPSAAFAQDTGTLQQVSTTTPRPSIDSENTQRPLPSFIAPPLSHSQPLQEKTGVLAADPVKPSSESASSSSKSTCNVNLPGPPNNNVGQNQSLASDNKQAWPAAVSSPHTPPSSSLAHPRVPSSHHMKHQPSRPSPLSHVTTFSSNAPPLSRTPSNATTSQRSPSFTTSSPALATTPQQPITPEPSRTLSANVDPKVNALDTLAFQMLLDKNVGIMKDVVQSISGSAIESALKQFQVEKEARELQDLRNHYLARIYGRRWRMICYKRRMIRKGRAHRERRLRHLHEQQEKQEKAKHAELEGMRRMVQATAAKANTSSVQTLQDPRTDWKRSSSGFKTGLNGGDSKKLKARSMPPISGVKSSPGHPLLAGSNMSDHARDPAFFLKPQQQTTTQKDIASQAKSASPSQARPEDAYVKPSSMASPFSRSRYLDSGYNSGQLTSTSTVQSPYFKLKAMGIDPNIGSKRKRERESSATFPSPSAELANGKEKDRGTFQSPKRLQTITNSSILRISPDRPLPRPATIPRTRPRLNSTTNYADYASLSQQRAAIQAADEAQLARAQRALEAFKQATSGIRPLKPRPAPGLSQTSPLSEPHMGAGAQVEGGSSDLLAQSRQLRQMMEDGISFYREERKKEEERSKSSSHGSAVEMTQSSSSFGGSVYGGVGRNERNQNVPKYWMRESKFVPREKYGTWKETGNKKALQVGENIKHDEDEATVKTGGTSGFDKKMGFDGVRGSDGDGKLASVSAPSQELHHAATSEGHDEDVPSSGDQMGQSEAEGGTNDENTVDDGSDDVDFHEDGDDEDSVGDEDESGENDDHGGGTGFVAPGPRFGFPASAASNMAFGAQRPTFDPKGKTGTSAEDAFELSD
ncbi:MAG: hypothetical protein M1822_010206 [Bathelium mastoideum]|nr:MAG: hypothetical protein M1822_010206 [Bathelium mastoideum]